MDLLFTKEIEMFYWPDLRQVPAWEDLQKALDELIEKGYIDSKKDTEVFDEFTLVLNYVAAQKNAEWNNLKINTATRCVYSNIFATTIFNMNIFVF